MALPKQSTDSVWSLSKFQRMVILHRNCKNDLKIRLKPKDLSYRGKFFLLFIISWVILVSVVSDICFILYNPMQLHLLAWILSVLAFGISFMAPLPQLKVAFLLFPLSSSLWFDSTAAPGSCCLFSAPIFERAFSPRNPNCFYQRWVLEIKVWVSMFSCCYGDIITYWGLPTQ